MALKKWELLNGDGPVKEWMQYDPFTKEMTVYREQQVEDIIETAKGHYAQTDEHARWEHDTNNHVGWLPDIVWLEYMQKGINLYTDQNELRKWLNDPDNKGLRSRPGRV